MDPYGLGDSGDPGGFLLFRGYGDGLGVSHEVRALKSVVAPTEMPGDRALRRPCVCRAWLDRRGAPAEKVCRACWALRSGGQTGLKRVRSQRTLDDHAQTAVVS